MNLETKPRLARGCRLREVEGAPATLQIPEGQIKMSGAGLEIVKLCDGTRSINEIIILLEEKYVGAPAGKIRSETSSFLQRLSERAVLRLS